MGKSLSIHPLVVLIVTALGGLLGGIIGLMIAVPLAVIGGSAISRLRSSGHLERAAERARPTAEKFLGVVASPSPEPDPSSEPGGRG
jgi:predicted PurR-regulated permease PerM